MSFFSHGRKQAAEALRLAGSCSRSAGLPSSSTTSTSNSLHSSGTLSNTISSYILPSGGLSLETACRNLRQQHGFRSYFNKPNKLLQNNSSSHVYVHSTMKNSSPFLAVQSGRTAGQLNSIRASIFRNLRQQSTQFSSVEASIRSSSNVRKILLPAGIFAAFGAGFTGVVLYKDYAEKHELSKPWNGDMIQVDGDGSLILAPSSVLEMIVDYMRLAVRACQLFVVFVPVVVSIPALLYGNEAWTDWWAELLLQTLMLAGPAFMKWGQWASARPDMFPQSICKVLERLQMDAPMHSHEYTEKVIEDAFGHKLDELFECQTQPLASGTIGQVYRAVLSEEGSKLLGTLSSQTPPPPGTPVALKIRHPNVQEAIKYDFTILKTIALLLNMVPQLEWLHLDEMTWQFESLLSAQVDLTVEATRLEHFNHNFKKWDRVAFPKPILAHPAALVETFEEGVPLSQYNNGRAKEEESIVNKVLAKLGISVVLKMMLVDNLVHADLHPGNILVRDVPGCELPAWEHLTQTVYQFFVPLLPSILAPSPPRPQLVLVDAGMTATMDQNNSNNLVSFFSAVSSMDGEAMSKAIIDFSVNFPTELHDRFQKDMMHVIKEFKEHRFDEEWSSFNDCLNTAMGTVREYGVCIEGAVCTVIVTSMMLSDLQQRLDPECSVMMVLEKILMGRTVSERIPVLKDQVEWFLGRKSVQLEDEKEHDEDHIGMKTLERMQQ